MGFTHRQPNIRATLAAAGSRRLLRAAWTTAIKAFEKSTREEMAQLCSRGYKCFFCSGLLPQKAQSIYYRQSKETRKGDYAVWFMTVLLTWTWVRRSIISSSNKSVKLLWLVNMNGERFEGKRSLKMTAIEGVAQLWHNDGGQWEGVFDGMNRGSLGQRKRMVWVNRWSVNDQKPEEFQIDEGNRNAGRIRSQDYCGLLCKTT